MRQIIIDGKNIPDKYYIETIKEGIEKFNLTEAQVRELKCEMGFKAFLAAVKGQMEDGEEAEATMTNGSEIVIKGIRVRKNKGGLEVYEDSVMKAVDIDRAGAVKIRDCFSSDSFRHPEAEVIYKGESGEEAFMDPLFADSFMIDVVRFPRKHGEINPATAEENLKKFILMGNPLYNLPHGLAQLKMGNKEIIKEICELAAKGVEIELKKQIDE